MKRTRVPSENCCGGAVHIWHETLLPPGAPQPVPSRTGVERRLRAVAPRKRDGVRGRPPFWPAGDPVAQSVACVRPAVAARPADGVVRASEFAARLEQFAHRNGVLAAEEVVVLSDGAPWIRTVCEEILPGGKMTFILDLYHVLEYASDAVQAAAPDEGEREEWIREQLNAGRVDRIIAALKPSRPASATARPTGTGCAATSAGSADCRSDPASWKALAISSSEADSKEPGATGRKREPTPCSPSDAALKTGAGPTSSNGGLAASQPHHQKNGPHPNLYSCLISAGFQLIFK